MDRVLLGDPEPLPYLARAVINNPADDLPRAVLFAQLAGSVPVIATLEHKAPVANALFAAGGRRVLTVSKKGEARLWSGSRRPTGRARRGVLLCAVCHVHRTRRHQSRTGAASSRPPWTAPSWAWEVGEQTTPTQGLPPFSAIGGVVDLQVSADGALAAIVTYDGLVRVWTTGPDVRIVSFSAAPTGAPPGLPPPPAGTPRRCSSTGMARGC